MSRKWIPTKEIQFASRMGFLTRSLWDEHFARDSQASHYRNWRRMTERGFFKTHSGSRDESVLVLNPTNETVVKICGDAVAKPPYLAQLRHDEILGNGILKLLKSQTISSYTTEAELRMIEPHRLHPNSCPPKLPDLLLRMGLLKEIAIELELTQKSRSRYRAQMTAYQHRESLAAIVFVVSGRAILEAILRAASDIRFPDIKMIGFVTLADWESDTPSAKVSFQSGVVRLSELGKLHLRNT